MAEVIHLTGTNEAARCLAAARTAETLVEVGAWLRLHGRYMRRTNVEMPELSFGDDEFGEMRRAHVGA